MHYLTIKHLSPGMVIAKAIVGDNGSILLQAGKQITEITLKRMQEMNFQGAYVNTPIFSDIIIDDIITNDLRTSAFEALKHDKIAQAAEAAKQIVKEIKYKDVLTLDLLDIKSDKNYIYKHSISVAVFAVVLGVGLDFTEEQLDNLAIAGMLHDIGKLALNEELLFSRSRYSSREMSEMEKHPAIAFERLREFPNVSSISRNAVLFHHENLDGSGYYKVPDSQIGIFPRILRVADVYDSMTANRDYRKAYSPAEAIEYIMGNAGKLFDRDVVNVFIKKFPVYPVGFTMRLSNGEMAVITSNDSNPMRPKVRTLTGRNIDLSTDPAYRSVLISSSM